MQETKQAIGRFRNFAYAGAGASFALILVLVPIAMPGTYHFAAIIGAISALPCFIGAGLMTESVLQFGDQAESLYDTEPERKLRVETLALGTLGLGLSLIVETFSVGFLVGFMFLFAIIVTMRGISVHRARLEKAIKEKNEQE